MRTLAATLVALSLSLTASSALAQSASTQTLTHETIANQIEAFRARDGELAYSYAAPGVKRFFRSPAAFMTMVERGYKPVYAPQSYSFGRYGERNGNVVQEVLITGPEGREWAALYTLEMQEDGTVLITSVQLARSGAKAI